MKSKNAILPFIVLFVSTCIKLNAATFTVTNTTDADPSSLRQAVLDANTLAGADTIVFDPTVFASPQTFTLASYLPINTDLVIIGHGADLLAISGNNITRIFHDTNFDHINNVVISGLEIKNASK